MKKRILFLSICLIIFLICDKVSAISMSFGISTMPEATVKGEFVVTKVSISDTSSPSFTFLFDNTDNLELVGFLDGGNGSCSFRQKDSNFNRQSIYCIGSKPGVVTYPVFWIKKDLNSSDVLDAEVHEGSNQASGARGKVTVSAKAKIVQASSIDLVSTKTTLLVNETAQLTATVSPDNTTDKTVTFTSSNPSVISVDNNGLITAVSAGSSTITANCGSAVKSIEITVENEVIDLKDLSLSKKELEMKIGDKEIITYTLDPTNATVDPSKVTYTSNDESVVIIDKNNKIVAVGAGEAKVTVSIGSISKSLTVKVNAEEVKESKNNSSLLAIIITAVVTFGLTVLGLFIKKIIDSRHDDMNDNSSSSNSEDNYIYPDHDPGYNKFM